MFPSVWSFQTPPAYPPSSFLLQGQMIMRLISEKNACVSCEIQQFE